MRDFLWPNGVHVRVVEPLTTYAFSYSDPGALEVDLTFEAIMAPNLHPRGRPVLEGRALRPGRPRDRDDGAARRGNAIDCYSVRDRLLGATPMGRPKPPDKPDGGSSAKAQPGIDQRRGPSAASATRSAPPAPARLGSRTPFPAPKSSRSRAGSCSRGEYGHILAGERRVTFDADTGWPLSIELEAVDDSTGAYRPGESVSRHWRGHGGDSPRPLALGQGRRRLGRGPELLQPRPVGAQPSAGHERLTGHEFEDHGVGTATVPLQCPPPLAQRSLSSDRQRSLRSRARP